MDQQNRLALRFLFVLTICFLLSLLFISPYLWSKLVAVRFFLKTWLGPIAPYVKPIPAYRGVNLQYPFFITLAWFSYRLSAKKTAVFKALYLTGLGLLLLWVLDCLATGCEIGIQTLSTPSNLFTFFIVFSLSLGPIVYPVIIWLLLFRPISKTPLNVLPKGKLKS